MRRIAHLEERFSCDIRNAMAVTHRWRNPVDCTANTVTDVTTSRSDYKGIDNIGERDLVFHEVDAVPRACDRVGYGPLKQVVAAWQHEVVSVGRPSRGLGGFARGIFRACFTPVEIGPAEVPNERGR